MIARSHLLLVLLASGCASTYRLEDRAPASIAPEGVQAVLRLRWQHRMTPSKLLDYKPQEWAQAAFDAGGGVYVGSSSGELWALEGKTGRLRWKVQTQGAINSTPLYEPYSKTLFFGSDDGRMYSVDTASGKINWSYQTQGTFNPSPAYSSGMLLFTTSEGRIYALDASTGAWRWQYDREMPEGFTIHGFAGVAVKGPLVYTGFADGVLVALQVSSGDVAWTRSLAGDRTRFLDVDAPPRLVGDVLYTASYAAGLFAVSADSGSILWQYPAEGITRLNWHEGRVYATAPKLGLLVLDEAGHLLYRQAIAQGVPASPVLAGNYLFITGSATGLYAAAAPDGQLLQYFNPGPGISAPPAVGPGGLLVVLSNGGQLYGFQVLPPG